MALDIAKKGKKLVRTVVRVLRAGMTPGLITYFFWSAVMYIGTGVFCLVAYTPIHEFLCAIPPEGYGKDPVIGCSGCQDNLLMCGKGLSGPPGKCWQYAVNLTIKHYTSGHLQSQRSEWEGAALDLMCADAVKEATGPVDMLQKLQAIYASPNAPDPTDDCTAFHCRVLKTALFVDKLEGQNKEHNSDLVGHKPCTNEYGMKPESQADLCVCNNVYTTDMSIYPTLDALCMPIATRFEESMTRNLANSFYVSTTQVPTVAPTTAGTSAATPAPTAGGGGGASARRLEAEPFLPCIAGSACEFADKADPSVEATVAAAKISSTATEGAVPRGLQASSPGPAPSLSAEINDGLQDYVVGAWTDCMCMQQCVTGVTSRSVTCPPNSVCKEPKPPSLQPCTCSHCAGCNVFYTIWLFAGGYLTQGLMCLLLWLAFYAISNYEEDDWTGVGYCTMCLGFFCKLLPAAVRLMTFFALAFLGVIVFQAFVPGFNQYDCKRIQLFQAMAVLVAVVWLLQLVLGIWMAQRQPMPPWLHYQSSNPWIRRLCKPCRKIGP